jgi:hypothetical protein
MDDISDDIHEVCNIFPAMSDEEYARLKADIAANGQREPIWFHDGKIIDGRHRARACAELGRPVKAREWRGEGNLTEFVVGLNLHHRHLNETQRAMVAARVKSRFEAEAKARPRAAGGDRNSQDARVPKSVSAHRRERVEATSRERAAQLLNVSPRSVDSAARVLRKGTPELVAAVERDQVKVSTAATVATLPLEEQRRIVARGPEAAKVAAREVRERKQDPTLSEAERQRRRFLKSLEEIDALTRAVAAKVKHGGYGGLAAVLEIIGRAESVRLSGQIEGLIERLQEWELQIKERFNVD